MADFPGVGRLQVSVFEINGKFIVGGGHRYGGGLSSTLNDYYEYDPKTNSWTTVFGFSEGRRTRSEGFSINGKGYIVSGSNTSSAYINNLWEYSFPSSVSIEEISTSMINTSSVYPNPTSGELFILVNNKALINAVFMLYNSKGQLVLEKEFNHTDSAAGLNLQNLERSTYYYKLVTQEGQMSTGVIIKTD